MAHQGNVFSRLPPEVIQYIAVTACGLTLAGPPAELATMLRLCRSVHAVLCVRDNPALHARIFSVKFDSQAPIRRFADAGEPLTALNFAHELQRRWITLKRIQDVSTVEALLMCSEEQVLEDLWLIHLMFLESDGRNLEQLHWARVSRYLRTILRGKLLPPPNSPSEYMAESTTRSLGLWLLWHLTEVYSIVGEDQAEAAPLRAMLRIWALACHKYDILYAPYTHWALPAPGYLNAEEELVVATPLHPADLTLHNRAEPITHMGHRIQLAPPRASLAAILTYMVRIERNGPIRAHPAPPAPNLPAEQAPPTTHPGLTIYPRTRYPNFRGPGSVEFDGRVNRTGSAAYDVEWRRALQCGNPLMVPIFNTMPMFRPGELAGYWQGRFLYLPFDVFRDMLSGSIQSVASGALAQMPHSWHIQEHHLISRRRRIPLGRKSDLISSEKLPIGNALDAHIPTPAQFIRHFQPSPFGTRHLEVRVPDSTSSLGYKSYYYTTLEGPTDHPSVRISTNEVVSANYPTNVDLPAGWNMPQPPSLGDGDDEFEEEILDTLITGEGRSTWGSFKIRGRIRAWDGMILMVKDDDLDIDGRGRWLYRGYLIGGNWVGRWRDTFTSPEVTGYEGAFTVTRMH